MQTPMQTVTRGESLARRAPSADPSTLRPARSRRVPSSSRIDLHPSISPIPSIPASSSRTSLVALQPLALSFFQSLSYFSAFTPLHTHPSLPSAFLALPAFFAAFLVFLFVSRLSLSTFRLHLSRPASRTALFCLTPLYIYCVLAACYAVRYLGPVRSLLAIAAYPTLSRLISTLFSAWFPRHALSPPAPPRLALLPLLLTVVALALLVHDTSGGNMAPSRAAHVRDRVLRNPTAKLVQERIRNFSTRVSHSLQNQSLYKGRRQRVRTPRLPRDNERRPNRLDADASLLLPSRKHDSSKALQDKNSHPPPRRKTLSIVKSDPSAPSISDSSNNRHSQLNQTQNNLADFSTIHTNISNSSANLIENAQLSSSRNLSTVREIFNSDPAFDESTLKNITVDDDDAMLQLSPLHAILTTLVAVSSPLAGRLASDAFDRLSSEFGDASSFITLVFFMCTVITFFVSIPCAILMRSSHRLGASFDIFNIVTKGFVLGLSFFVMPTYLRFSAKGYLRPRAQSGRPPKTGASSFFSVDFFSLLDFPTCVPNSLWMYSMTLFTVALIHVFKWTTSRNAESVTLFSALSGLLLLLASRRDLHLAGLRPQKDLSRSRPAMSSGRIKLTSIVWKGGMTFMRHFGKTIREGIANAVVAMADLGAHARTNRASWQVLNFLVLQSGMAVVELIYASATHARGLFSISADNLFCSIALAIGLLAIRVSVRKSSSSFTYGYSRIESVCGFANGIMLIYVAVLIVLEAFERVAIGSSGAVGRAFSVCLFGIVGNGLGLYFFPPETRRENHNVQGIYLHIVANTLAFASVAVSTATTAVVPEWRTVDIGMAIVVAFGVVGFSIPLIVRSGRLLLLMVPREKVAAMECVEDRLLCIGGVCVVSGLRIWNLTPNCVIASVRLEVERDSDSLHGEVLAASREVFALMGIAASQCTIQISHGDISGGAV